MTAYATRQAEIRRGWSSRCASLWRKTLAGQDVDRTDEDGSDDASGDQGSGDQNGEGEGSADADDDAGVVEIEVPEDVVAYLEIDADEFA